MGVTPSFRRCPVTGRPGRALGPAPELGRSRLAGVRPHGSCREPPRHPSEPRPALARGRTRARRFPTFRTSSPPGPQKPGALEDGEKPETARRGQDTRRATPAGSLRPRTHLSFSAGALAAVRGVSSAAGQGHASDVSTQETYGRVPREWEGRRERGWGRRCRGVAEFSPEPGSASPPRTRTRTRTSAPLAGWRLHSTSVPVVVFVIIL